MTLWKILVGEVRHRTLSFVLGLVAVTVAVGCLQGALVLLRVHDLHTQAILGRKEQEMRKQMAVLKDEMRKAMLKLSFNLVILPENQDLREWHVKGYSEQTMPEEYVTRLANSGIITVRHFLPSLQRKIVWPEKQRTIILVGSRGEVPNPFKSSTKPLVQPVPKGTIVLGHELHRSLKLKEGDRVALMGRELTVHKCHSERGSKDDITAWIELGEAQELLDKPGKVNAILALECLCAGADALPKIRREIVGILPGTQVVEYGSKVLARMESRMKVGQEARTALAEEKRSRTRLKAVREQVAAVLVPLVILVCCVWLAVLGFTNVRARRTEIGILRAIGFRSWQVLALFLAKSFVTGLVGGTAGFFAGWMAGIPLAHAIEQAGVEKIGLAGTATPAMFAVTLAAAVVITTAAGWIPAMLAAQQDPATTLQRE